MNITLEKSDNFDIIYLAYDNPFGGDKFHIYTTGFSFMVFDENNHSLFNKDYVSRIRMLNNLCRAFKSQYNIDVEYVTDKHQLSPSYIAVEPKNNESLAKMKFYGFV